MKFEKSISVVVPVYNEIALIENSLRRINEFLSNCFDNYEILVVESGSTDGSCELLDKLALSFQYVKIIHEGARNGFGSALKLGYKNATKDLVWMITFDLPFPLEIIKQTIPLFDKYDVILSYRSSDDRGMFRKMQSFVYNLIVKLALGLQVRHVNSAFKVFKRSVIQNMDIKSNGWFVDAEIVYNLCQSRVAFTEIPVEVVDRTLGCSSINFATPWSLLKELVNFIVKTA